MTIDDLYEQAKLQWQLDDMKWISNCKRWISDFEGRYQENMANKNFKIADLIRDNIDLIKIDIKRTEHELLTQYGGSEVSTSQFGRSETVFILKK